MLIRNWEHVLAVLAQVIERMIRNMESVLALKAGGIDRCSTVLVTQGN